MPVIEVHGLAKAYGDKLAVDDLSFSVEESEILVIVGSSGCGKTTTLRAIAGLDTPTRGTIRIDGRTVVSDSVNVAPEKRGIGMVFQSYALWPHKTVFQNVAYPLVVARRPKDKIAAAVERALAQVGLPGAGDRLPATLSGGQQQRVALARCAVAESRVLLLDEPLSNLDAKLREQMQMELKGLIRSLNSTAVHITHDQTEAMAIADRIIVMRDGRVEQIGSPREIYRQPASRFVADFIGTASFVDGIARAGGNGALMVEVRPGLSLAVQRPAAAVAPGAAVTLCLRPEDLHLTAENAAGPNRADARVEEAVFLGNHIEYLVDVAGLKVKVRSQMDVAPGAHLRLWFDAERIAVLPAEPRRATAAA